MMTEQEVENQLVLDYMAQNNWDMPDVGNPDADYSDLELAVEQVKWFIRKFKQAGYVQVDEDQTTPANSYYGRKNQEVHERAIRDMLNSGFRRIRRE